jgi:DNA (cytosine-5)-methyltransferase 1
VSLHKKVGKSVELFSGCGGLALGLSFAGFEHELLVERDKHACATLSHNKTNGDRLTENWTVQSNDVRAVDWKSFAGSVTLVAGGPPCQPFSIGGKAAGNQDERDMWPESVRSVREIGPTAFIFENVRGLLRPRFSSYVDWILAYLSNPSVVMQPGETHADHMQRLLSVDGPSEYAVQLVDVNAADYGAPQKRKRVLFIGFRRDQFPEAPRFPRPTHSNERLMWDKWVSGEYWTRHGLQRPGDDKIPEIEMRIASRLRESLIEPDELPWQTCRDAFKGLGEPGTRPDLSNHSPQPGARSYAGHTGSPIDEPAKALKAGVHGVPGGENMLALEGGSVRYFSIREAARLQGIPDGYEFPGSWTESMRQIGNAVPVHLSRFAGQWIADQLRGVSTRRRAA